MRGPVSHPSSSRISSTMSYPKPFVFSRTAADPIMEELIKALADGEATEFKGLFAKVHAELKLRKVGGGMEVLKLRCYDRLLKLASTGVIEKRGKTFRALAAG